MATIQRPFNPFLVGGLLPNGQPYDPALMSPQPMAQQPQPMPRMPGQVPLRQPAPMAPPQTFMPPPAAASAFPLEALAGQPSGGGLKEGVGNFLGSDAALAFAAGILGGGSSSQALSRGFGNAYQARQKGTQEFPEAYRLWELAGKPGNFNDWYMSTKKASSSNVTTNVAGEKAWDTESAKLFAKKYDQISTQAQSASEMLGLYDLAEAGLDSGVRTGSFGSSEQAVRQFGLAMGIGDADKVAGGELLTGVQNRMALMMRSPDSGMGMPGAVSDRDLIFLKDAQIGIDRSPEGNRKMLAAFKRLETRKIEIAQLADQYVQENGQLDAGFNQMVRMYAEENPLFDDLKAGASAGNGGAGQQPTRRRYNPATGQLE